MANLEELGYLEQPHVSAGRIPSSQGYRFYVDSIMQEKKLTPSEKQVIDQILKEDVTKFETLIKEASNIIARLTNYASIAIGPAMDSCQVEEIKLVKIGQDRLMIVILAIPALRTIFSILILPVQNIVETILLVIAPVIIVEIFKLLKINGDK